MNRQVKTILFTILTMSLFVIALVELSGVSSTALFNKYNIGSGAGNSAVPMGEAQKRQAQAAVLPNTTMKFDETRYKFGTIKDGEVVKHRFHFINTGTNPLFIVNAQPSCGCTVTGFPKEAIGPGGDGYIDAQFNSEGHLGHQSKNILVHSNAEPSSVSIGFEADVEMKKE